MPQYRLSIRGDERVAFVGKTGSGKTYAARYLTRALSRLVIFDPKGTIDPRLWRLQPYDSGTSESDGLQEFKKGGTGRLLIRAPVPGITRLPTWSDYLQEVWALTHVTVYIDELYGILPASGRPDEWLKAMYTRGRELGIGTWAATQRPAWVPLFTLSESEWLFMFRLQLAEDRKRMAEIGLGDAALVPIRDPHGLLIYNAIWDQPLYAPSLEIGPNEIAIETQMAAGVAATMGDR